MTFYISLNSESLCTLQQLFYGRQNVENGGIYSITVRRIGLCHRAMSQLTSKRARATFNDCANFIGYRITF